MLWPPCLERSLQHLQYKCLTMNRDNCHLLQLLATTPPLKGRRGARADSSRATLVPTNVQMARSFLGMANFRVKYAIAQTQP